MDDSYSRVARALADVETTEEKQQHWHEKFLWALRHGAIPAGRITSNAGALEHKPATSTINCTVSGVVEDSMDNILDKVHEAGLTLKAGCGIGYEFSTLRPKAHLLQALAHIPAALYLLWISTTKCVSPCHLRVVVEVRKWQRLILAIQMLPILLKPNVKMVVCVNSTFHVSLPKSLWKRLKLMLNGSWLFQ